MDTITKILKEKAAKDAGAKDGEASVAVAPIQSNKALPPEELNPVWGAAQDVEAQDLLVPKIFHQQALSKFSVEGKARAGEFCDSITGEVLSSPGVNGHGPGLAVIVFGLYKTALIEQFDPIKSKWHFKELVPVTPVNAVEIASKPFEEEIGGEKFRNSILYNFYCLLPDRLNELPYVLSLGRTKSKAAKKLTTAIYKIARAGKPSASVVFLLSSVVEKNEQGTWFGLEVTQSRASTEVECREAYEWWKKSCERRLTTIDPQDEAF